jgi:acetyl esterase/lipase
MVYKKTGAQLVDSTLGATLRLAPAPPFHWRATSILFNLIYRIQAKCRRSSDAAITESPIGDIPVRIYKATASTNRGAMLWIHGGGFITGHHAMNDRECLAFAKLLICI